MRPLWERALENRAIDKQLSERKCLAEKRRRKAMKEKAFAEFCEPWERMKEKVFSFGTTR